LNYFCDFSLTELRYEHTQSLQMHAAVENSTVLHFDSELVCNSQQIIHSFHKLYIMLYLKFIIIIINICILPETLYAEFENL